MNVKYLNCYDDVIFDVVLKKTDEGLKCNTIFINPLCRLINDKIDSQFLVNALASYSELVQSISIKKSSQADLIFDQSYFVFGVTHFNQDSLHFVYSEEFTLHPQDYKIVKDRSLSLANIILSVLEKNLTDVYKNLEEEINEMYMHNNSPIKKGFTDVLGIVLNSTENNNIYPSIKYYSESVQEIQNKYAINKMLDEIFGAIVDKLKDYNLFMVKEPVVILTLSIDTKGGYFIIPNNILLKSFTPQEKIKIHNLLITTYKNLFS